MSGWIACHSSRASWALPWCFLPPSIWNSKIAVGGKTKFSCHWATNTIFILHRFITCLQNVSLPLPLQNKAGQHGWCLAALCTGGCHWEQDCQMSWQNIPWKGPNDPARALDCREWVLSNCNSTHSPHAPGDQELLKSWHWNSIWWFITVSFIDPVHAEGPIQPGTWAGILLWGSTCVLALCFAPILNGKYIPRTNLSGLYRRGIVFPSECQLQQDLVRVVQQQSTLREETWASTERTEEHPHNPLQCFCQSEVEVGKQPMGGDDFQLWMIISHLQDMLEATPRLDSTRLLYPTNMISARLWAWYGWKGDWQCPQPISYLHMQPWVIRRPIPTSLPHFFLTYCPLWG